MKTIINWITNSFAYDTDSEAEKLRKAILVIIAIGMSFGGLGWGIMCLFYDAKDAAYIPFGYTTATILNFVVYRLLQNYSLFRFTQFLLSLLLPFLLQWGLGGFTASGGVMLWAILSPLGGLMFYSSGRSAWFIAFLILTIASTVFDPYFVEHFYVPDISKILYPMNFIVVNVIVFFIFKYFVTKNQSIFSDLDSKIDKLSEITNKVKHVSSKTSENSQNLSMQTTNTSHYLQKIEEQMNSIKKKFTNLSQNIQEVRSSIEKFIQDISHLNSQIENQNQIVNKVSGFISQINTSINQVRETTLEKVQDANKLVNLTNEGFTKVGETNSMIESIVKQTDSMKAMLEIINGISNKTHLLAMNASIEAAHASTEGKGFAVVAGEIRKLADSTASNSKKIAQSLKEIIDIINLSLESSYQNGATFNLIQDEVLSVMNDLKDIEQKTTLLSQNGGTLLPEITSLSDNSQEIITKTQKMVSSSEHSKTILEDISNVYGSILQDIQDITKETELVNLSMKEVIKFNNENSENIDELTVLIKEE